MWDLANALILSAFVFTPPPVNITALCYFCNIFIYGIDMLEFWGIFIKGFEWLYNIIMCEIAFIGYLIKRSCTYF